jgi:membrane-bound lytic murein transglycosylase A
VKRSTAAQCLLAALLLGVCGCALPRDLDLPDLAAIFTNEEKTPTLLAQVPLAAVPALADDSDENSLLACVRHSLDQLERLPLERTYQTEAGPVQVADLLRTLTLFQQALVASPRPIDWRALLGDRFRLLRAAPPGGLLFTGYFQPELRAAREPSERYAYPLYEVPYDLVRMDRSAQCPECEQATTIGRLEGDRLVPYYSRAEIDGYGVLRDRDAELAWVDDPVDLFLLHVQGSGLLRFEDGTAMRVGFAGSNGREYRSIGKILVDAGKVPLESASLESLRRYLREHPAERDEILFANERYVFFRPLPVGPIGSLGVPLVPGRSIAVDPGFYPLGGLAWIRTERPGEDGATVGVARFACVQDAGAAIAGPGRVDVFWGGGVEAERMAGGMRAGGEMLLLLAR